MPAPCIRNALPGEGGEKELTRFEKDPGNPVYGGAETGTLFDVYVTRTEAGCLRMDFSWRPERALAVAFSEDGLTWTPPRVTLPADPESGWEDDVNRNCVLKVGGRYRMWYTGQARGRSWIGCAQSGDGLTFTREGSGPVLTPELPWEGESVMNPCVLLEDGRYRMWYSAGETYEPNVLGYAESMDGLHWKKRPEPVFTRCPENVFEQDRIGGCQVLPHRELGYLLFYIGYRDIDTASICCAYSGDGVTQFHRCRRNPLASPDPGAWDGDACYKPSALRDEAGDLWRIWYNGRRGADEFIGTAAAKGDFSPADFD